jgi:radical SAM protein with 4Fe4S-binding SPASM domain
MNAANVPDFSSELQYRRMLKEIVEEQPISQDHFGQTLFPSQICIETTCACNQSCLYCGRTYMERQKGNMPRWMWNKIIDEVSLERPTTEILPAYMGEALLAGDELFDRLAAARRLGCRKVTLNTNGTLLTKYASRIVEGNIDRLVVSCDAHDPATHRVVRPGKGTGLDDVYQGIHAVLDLIRTRKLSRPLLEVAFTVFDENEHETESFVQYWLAQGVIVKTRPKVFHSGVVPGGHFRVTIGPERNPCAWIRDTMVILSNGNVVLCTCDVDAKFVAGNVEAQTIREIWNGSLKWVRELHLRRRFRDLPEICRKCTDWQTRRSHTFFPNDNMKQEYTRFVQAGHVFTYEPADTRQLLPLLDSSITGDWTLSENPPTS